MFNPASRQNWNEFQWEKEIRKDELRINRYFQALRVCLDLPGEEEMIFKRLMSQQDLVPTGVEWSQQSLSEFYAQHDEEDEENPPDDFCHRAGYDLLRQLDRQAREWNVVFAAGLRGSFLREGLALTCRFGKLLSRFSNFIEIDDPEMRALKISLGKRVLADLRFVEHDDAAAESVAGTTDDDCRQSPACPGSDGRFARRVAQRRQEITRLRGKKNGKNPFRPRCRQRDLFLLMKGS